MRIVGNIEHPSLKITIFKMDDKFSVKFENGFFEQTVKIRSFDGLSTVENIKDLIDANYMIEVERIFAQMSAQKMAAFKRFLPADLNDEFEEII